MRRDVFQAIADPRRREIIGLLTKRTMNLNAVAEHFDISRPAISKHVKILRECGLVAVKKEGREMVCSVDLRKLEEIDQWLQHYRDFWNRKLDALQVFLDEEANSGGRSK